jgi:hypothetical protein
MAAKRHVDAAGCGQHQALWQHAAAGCGWPEAEEPWLDPTAIPALSTTASGRGAGGEGGVWEAFEEDVDAVEKKLRMLGGDPRAGRARGADQEVDHAVTEDRAMLLQIKAEKELRARVAEKKVRQEAAAAAAAAAAQLGVGSGDGVDTDSYSNDDSDGSSSIIGGGVGSGVGEQHIKTFPVEDNDRVPSNRIHRPEDNPCAEGRDGGGACRPQPPAPGLFSSLDEDSDGGGAGKGMGLLRSEPGGETSDTHFGQKATEVEQDGVVWVLDEELVQARLLPPVRWIEGRHDERTLAEIGRFQPLPPHNLIPSDQTRP